MHLFEYDLDLSANVAFVLSALLIIVQHHLQPSVSEWVLVRDVSECWIKWCELVSDAMRYVRWRVSYVTHFDGECSSASGTCEFHHSLRWRHFEVLRLVPQDLQPAHSLTYHPLVP